MMWIWEELEIEPTDDAHAIRKAYAQRLKQVHPEDDPGGFKRLRAAYEAALSVGTRQQTEPRQMRVASEAPPESESQEAAYEQRLARVGTLAQELLGIAKERGCDAAVARLQSRFTSEEFQDLELQFLLKSSLRGPHLEEVSDRFRADQAYADLIRRREQLRLSASQRNASHEETVRYLALLMLTSRFNLVLFYRSLWRYPELAKVVPARIQALQQETSSAVDRHLDAKTVHWWTKRRPPAVPPLASYFRKHKLVTVYFAFMIASALSQATFLTSLLRPFLVLMVMVVAVSVMIEGRWPRFDDRLKAFPYEIGLLVGALLALFAVGIQELPTVKVSSPNLGEVVQAQEKAGVPSGFLLEKIFWLSKANWYGLKPGDIITKYGSDRVTDGKSFEDARNLRISVHTQRVQLAVMRGGKLVEFDVPVGPLGFEGRNWTLLRDKIVTFIRQGERDHAAQLLIQAEKDGSLARQDLPILKKLLAPP